MRTVVVVGLLFAAACNKDSANATTDQPPPQPPPVQKKAPPGVEVFVDDASVTRITPEQAQAWVRLDTVVPEQARRLGKWASLSIKSGTDKPQEMTKPTERYPDKVPALFPAPDGSIAFGMFDAVEYAKHGKPAFEQVGLSELRIKIAADTGHGGNDDGNSPPGDPTKTSIVVKTATGEVALQGDKLLGIKRDASPDGSEAQGWKLATLLEAAGVKKFDKLTLYGDKGTNLMLDKAEVSATSVPFFKLNRQAKLKLRVYTKKGDGWTPTKDLKDVQRIEVK